MTASLASLFVRVCDLSMRVCSHASASTAARAGPARQAARVVCRVRCAGGGDLTLFCSAFKELAGRTRGCWAQGYAFCELADVGKTDFVITNLNGKQVGNKFLTVKRALQPSAAGF